MEFESGETAQGEVYLQRLLEAMRRNETDPRAQFRTSMTIATRARNTGDSDRLEMAQAAAERVLAEQVVMFFSRFKPTLLWPCWPCRKATVRPQRSIMNIF